ncbi:MAG: MBL fold metallo-hydrolase [Rhodospirillaceae bacterium]|jgi:7,8-dihydropterin-6-yl-methyl-4-(beta-D-ribofuranosyl)aminobenzene 5'-phosphate synthase
MTRLHAPFEPPIVDSLSIRVLVDSAYERFLPKASHDFCSISHVGKIPGRQMTTLACEWGLSLHLESISKGVNEQYLLDFGYTPEIISRNFELLDIKPEKISGLILSHAHRDHYGGMEGFIDKFRYQMRDDIRFFIGGHGVFRERWTGGAGGDMVSWGALDRTALTAQNVRPIACESPTNLGGAFTTGYIERESFEIVTGGSMVLEEDVEDHFSDQERKGQLVKDTHPEEHATCYVVNGRGLVVISSCGHTGIVNTINTAKAVTNVDKVHAVIGGFHLGTSTDEYIAHTVKAFKEFDPDVVLPMHCSGRKFIEAMQREMPEKLVTTNVGTKFTFGV